MESLGGKFIEVPLGEGEQAETTGGYARAMSEDYKRRQGELIQKHAQKADIVVTTALIPGKKAPVLITEQAVKGMQPGSVIVDTAAERGGNCELTRPNHRTVTENAVTIFGPTNLAASVPHEACAMYAKNISAFLLLLVKDGELAIDLEDEIVAGTLVTRDGEVVHKRVVEALAEVRDG